MFEKITNEELESRGVETLPNQPLPPTDEIKREFDALPKEVIAPHFNQLSNDLDDFFVFATDEQIDSLFSAIPPFGTATEAQLANIINGYYQGLYSLSAIQRAWHVGDTRDIDISAIPASDTFYTVGESHRAQTVTIQILDFEHDELVFPINGKTKALITVDLKECLQRDKAEYGEFNLENGYMAENSSNSWGWYNCPRRAWCEHGFYNSLPEYIQNLVKPVVKYTSQGLDHSEVFPSADRVFLLSEIEVFKEVHYSFEGEGFEYALYAASNRYPDTYGGNYEDNTRSKKPKWTDFYTGSSWKLRSPTANSISSYCIVSIGNIASSHFASIADGIAPAFCM